MSQASPEPWTPTASARGGNHQPRDAVPRLATLGVVGGVLVIGGSSCVMLAAGWSPGRPTAVGSPLHETYLQATTMTWAGIVACQIGAAFGGPHEACVVARGRRALQPHLLRGVAFALVFAAVIIVRSPRVQRSSRPRHCAGLREPPCSCASWRSGWGSDQCGCWRRRGRPSLCPAAIPSLVPLADHDDRQPPAPTGPRPSTPCRVLRAEHDRIGCVGGG